MSSLDSNRTTRGLFRQVGALRKGSPTEPQRKRRRMILGGIAFLSVAAVAVSLWTAHVAAASPQNDVSNTVGNATETRWIQADETLSGVLAASDAYSPTFDVDRSGEINVIDIMQVAGRWRETGTWYCGCASSSGDLQASRFVDSDNTSYYVDPFGNSHLGTLEVKDWIYNNSGDVEVGDDLRAYDFIDIDNTSYHVNPYGDSRLGTLEVRDWIYNNGGDVEVGDDLYVVGDISASGSKSFVQQHPTEPDKAIIYSALEGGEVGTYYRGTTRLDQGTAVVELPDHFGMVTEDEGLTVQVTPRGDCHGLYVSEVTAKTITVRELQGGNSSVEFDFFINGVRKGYQNYKVIDDASEAMPRGTAAAREQTTEE